MKSKIVLLLAWISAGLLFSNFTACESDSEEEGGGKNGLVGRYWAQHEYQMEQLIENVDNASIYKDIWNDNGKTNYSSFGNMYYFKNKNTVHMINYIGVKSLKDAVKMGYYNKDLLFTLTYGDDTVYYYGDLDNPYIYSYELADGKLYIYSNSNFDQYNMVDGGFVLNGGSTLYKNIELGSEIVKENPTIEITEGQKVDLGLSVKWAGWNIGAKSPEQYGGYYAWGEVTEKYNYSTDSYTCNWEGLSKMNIGSTEYDVARAEWGDEWRLPSRENLAELINNCTWTFIRYKGTYGAKVTGPNGNSIFFPFPGYKVGNKAYDDKNKAFYWLDSSETIVSSVKYGQILYLEVSSSGKSFRGEWYFTLVELGCSVRAVSDN